MDKKRILFVTGTRADYGKLKPLMTAIENDQNFDLHVFVTGMHMHKLYGNTYIEVFKDGYENIFRYFNSSTEERMDNTLSRTIQGISDYVQEIPVDLIIVHGDRVEALAGALVGSLNNILVGHIEGGELSGTVDEIIRHSISKLSHSHFVSNKTAKKRLIQLGEVPDTIFEIGSPDLDIMFSSNLPSLEKVKSRYDITFDEYSIVMFHPVTTEKEKMGGYAYSLVDALLESEQNYVIIYPNNDSGSNSILKEYDRLKNSKKFRLLPSMRFEHFLTLLKNANACIGNSSAGIREAPAYGIYTVNIGTRQNNRSKNPSIIHTGYGTQEILNAIQESRNVDKLQISNEFGDGKSTQKFIGIVKSSEFWLINKQKQFLDLDVNY